MSRRDIVKTAFIRSLPILCSYLFLGIAYGILMEEAGLPWFWTLTTSLTVYTGAFQFVLISLLSSGASLVTVALTAFLINSRQTFYALSYVEDFSKMGRRQVFMIHTLTDETYAVNGTLTQPDEDRRRIMFVLAVLCYLYWAAAGVIGGILGQLIPWDMTGIDFCMTALFIIIFIDHWEKNPQHFPATAGAVIAVICLLIFGAGSFMLPALLMTSAALLIWDSVRHRRDEASEEMP